MAENKIKESLEELDQENSGSLQIDAIVEAPSAGLELADDDPSMLPDDPTIGDALYTAVQEGASPDDLFSSMIQEVAEELSFLKASRKAHFFGGGNFSNISEKRLKGIKSMAELVALKNKEFAQLIGAEVDFKGEGFKNVMSLFLRLVKKSMEDSSIPSEAIQSVFARLQKELIGYEDMAKKVYKGEKVENVLDSRSK